MEKEYKLIESRLRTHAADHFVDEKLFNIGVEFGRLLEQQSVSTFRLPFFIEQDNKKQSIDAKLAIADQVCKTLLKLIVNAVKEQVLASRIRRFTFGVDRTEAIVSQLSAEISNKYCFQHEETRQENEDSDFQVIFRAINELAEIFERYEIDTALEVELYNSSSGKSETLYSDMQVEKSFGISRYSLRTPREMSVDSLQNFSTEVEKFVLFKLLRAS